MVLKKGNRLSKAVAVRSYANLLQQHLGIIVLPVYFYYAGWSGPVEGTPCSLISVEPYCPGGTRRLLLNVKHPLITAIAKISTSKNAEEREIAIAMGEAMVWTGTWPLPGLDLSLPSGHVYWKQAKGLNCGQYYNQVPATRHEVVYYFGSEFPCIAIWPRRAYSIALIKEKSAPSEVEMAYSSFGEKWEKRDQLLLHEWKYLMKQNTVPRQASMCIPDEKSSNTLLQITTYSPALPILALASFLQKSQKEKEKILDNSDITFLYADRASSMGIASAILLSCDRLFCLSLFFNVPLIDRTRTLKSAINAEILVRPTPSSEEITRYRDEAPKDAYEALEKAMMERAETIWLQANGRRVVVCWSGGIDSTSLLVCLFRSQDQGGHSTGDRQLLVTYDEESISENPVFYENHLRLKVPTTPRNDLTMSEIARKFSDSLVVTGELGDQIFGSDTCRVAFPKPTPSEMSAEEKKILILSGALESDEDRILVSLDQPWEESLLRLLQARGLLAGEASEWITWMTPQLSKAPFLIKSLYDMLWWLNFSCKWQNVKLRCHHDGGEYIPGDGITGNIIHFFDYRQLECWACVEEFHRIKFPDLKRWTSYKTPLKKLIFTYDDNEEYYQNKEKVGSLAFKPSDSQEKRIESCVGLVTNAKGRIERLTWGDQSVTDCHLNASGVGLEHFLDSWILNQIDTTPSLVENKIHVNPWEADTESSSPFTAAPWFAEQDERKHRVLNPITTITLTAKCSALLPPDIIKGKSVLDLGACLGAMCHWSLFNGASKAVGVEPQKDFCERMERYLVDAQDTWPESQSSAKRYEVICADAKGYLSTCKDQSFDVVVAAGVLHCFQDPVGILLELARVSKEAVVIESVHPTFHRKGFAADSHAFSGPLLELNPSAAVNKAGQAASFAGLSVVPTKDLMKKLFMAVGFSVSSINLEPHPNRNEDVLVYTGNRFYDSSPVRFFLRCRRRSKESVILTSLEEVIEKGEGSEHQWKDAIAHEWVAFRPQKGETKQHSEPPGLQSNNVFDVFKNIFLASDGSGAYNKSLNHDKMKIQQQQTPTENALLNSPEPFKAWYDVESRAEDVEFHAAFDEYPYSVQAWGHLSDKKSLTFLATNTTIYGYVFSGETTLKRKVRKSNLESKITEGISFCCPGEVELSGGSGVVITVERRGVGKRNCGMFTLAGPIETDASGEMQGILPYIDGCSDSVLIHPQVRGEPCLNHLHFPPHIKQTQHTHPSGRAGMVIQGEGYCVIVDPVSSKITKISLRIGMVFVIPTDSPHAFETGNRTLDVIAFHPDSDYGPIATDHPMVNRTIVNGVSASLIPSIQTKLP